MFRGLEKEKPLTLCDCVMLVGVNVAVCLCGRHVSPRGSFAARTDCKHRCHGFLRAAKARGNDWDHPRKSRQCQRRLDAQGLGIIEKVGPWSIFSRPKNGSTSLQNSLFQHNAKSRSASKRRKTAQLRSKQPLRFSTTLFS